VGVQAAGAVLAFRHGDGSNQLGDLGPGLGRPAEPYGDWTGYRPVNELGRLLDPNRWQPLPTPDGAGQRFLVPHWGLVAPFALRPAGSCGRGGRGATPDPASWPRPPSSWPTAPG
jgi:hypothetical protein